MSNPFKKILQDKELPAAIKEKVIADVNLIKLSLDLTELFVVNIPDVASRMFDSGQNEDRGKKETEE